jgi:protein SCO1
LRVALVLGGADLRKLLIAGLLALLAPAFIAGGAWGVSGDGDRIGLAERPGSLLPLDAILRDDTGAELRLGDLTDRPLLMTFVYFSCSRQCPLVLGGLAEALGRLPLRPGEDYAVATVSIDDRDTPASAAAAKRNYLPAIGRPFPASAWRFLTGDGEALRRITDAVGLRYERHGEHLFHPETLVVVAPGGVVASYLPVDVDRSGARAGIAFQPAQLQLALADARRGRIGPGRPQQILYCFPFERDVERSFYRLLRVFGALNLLGLAAVLAYLVFRKPRSAGKKER